MTSKYCLSQGRFTYFRNHKISLNCAKCGGSLNIGDEIVSECRSSYGASKKLFHKACWEAMFIEVKA